MDPKAVATFLMLLVVKASSSKVVRTTTSYVISVDHQVAGQQPYARSAQSKAMSISLGTSGNKVPYKFTVDTGSGVLLATCRTPTSLANCDNKLPTSSNYMLSPGATVSDTATCDSTGIGCMLSPSNTCFLSEQLTGGGDLFNINNAIVAKDAITFNNATTITTKYSNNAGTTHVSVQRKAKALSFIGLFGCAEAYLTCTPSSPTNCVSDASTCPDGNTPSGLFQGACPGSGSGIEAGWTFNVGGPASAMAVPEQAFKAGLISKKVTGFCYLRPQKDFSCAATNKPNSAVVLGPALPRAIPSASRLFKAPLIPAVFPSNVAAGEAIPQTHTMRSNVDSVSVPVYGSDAPWVSTDFEDVSILWDTGAYGQSTVTTPVYNAFVQYFEAAWAAVNASAPMQRYKFVIQKCPVVSAVCGDNILSSALHSCLQIEFPTDAPNAERQAARKVLASLYPASIQIKPQGGGIVKLATAFPLNLCSGKNFANTEGIAVCSYIQPPNIPSASYFWLAGPFFHGRFVQFEASGPMAGYPESVGTISWSNSPIDSCQF